MNATSWRIARHVLLVALVPLLLAPGGCGRRPPGRPTSDEPVKLPRLEAALPQYNQVEVTSELTATVEAFEKTDLCAQVRGVVNHLPPDIEIGRPIQKGEALFTIDTADLLSDKAHKLALADQAEKAKQLAEQARAVAVAEVTEAEAQEHRYRADLQFRELQHKRILELSKRETVQPQLSEESLMQRDAAQAALSATLALAQTKRARLKSAEGEIELAKSKIDVARTEVARVATLIGFATIKAPFDGVITKRWVDRGATIKDPGMPLLTVMRVDRVRVVLDVPERDVPYIHAKSTSSPASPATPVTLRVPALQKAVFEGHVALMSGALDPTTRTMRVEVHLDNKSGRLRPQMTGTAQLILARRDRVLTVPSSALVRAGDKMEVYYIDNPQGTPPRGVVKRAVVELGLDDGVRVEIRSGLTAQERVVTKGNGVVRIGETAIAAETRAAELR